VFLTLMVIGLVGLVMMAVPALGGHRHLPPIPTHGHGAGVGHAGVGHHGAGVGHHGAQTHELARGGSMIGTGLRFIPSPRAVFSVFALYGAFGNALVHAAHLPRTAAALIAIVPAFVTEWFLIRPIWNLLFRFQGEASTPLEQLILGEAHAVVPFRNGRGVITTVRDGRRVQLSARLSDAHAAAPVAVGQRLRIEDVDARRECVTVSVSSDDKTTDTPT
jgi:hypothetical protein